MLKYVLLTYNSKRVILRIRIFALLLMIVITACSRARAYNDSCLAPPGYTTVFKNSSLLNISRLIETTFKKLNAQFTAIINEKKREQSSFENEFGLSDTDLIHYLSEITARLLESGFDKKYPFFFLSSNQIAFIDSLRTGGLKNLSAKNKRWLRSIFIFNVIVGDEVIKIHHALIKELQEGIIAEADVLLPRLSILEAYTAVYEELNKSKERIIVRDIDSTIFYVWKQRIDTVLRNWIQVKARQLNQNEAEVFFKQFKEFITDKDMKAEEKFFIKRILKTIALLRDKYPTLQPHADQIFITWFKVKVNQSFLHRKTDYLYPAVAKAVLSGEIIPVHDRLFASAINKLRSAGEFSFLEHIAKQPDLPPKVKQIFSDQGLYTPAIMKKVITGEIEPVDNKEKYLKLFISRVFNKGKARKWFRETLALPDIPLLTRLYILQALNTVEDHAPELKEVLTSL